MLTVVDALTYYQLFSSRYPKILPVDGSDWPTDADNRCQSVQVNFTAGYGATFDNVPADLVEALMQQITNMYENRGDCNVNDPGDVVETARASGADSVFDQIKIPRISQL